MNRKLYWVLSLVLALIVTAFAPALAHEGREVGAYTLVFGWRNEPAYAGMMNGPEIFISMGHSHDHDDHSSAHTIAFVHGDGHGDEPKSMADVPVDLRAEVTFGAQTTTVTFRRAWGTDDHYIAELIPTLPGDYTFRVFGTIGEVEVDEIFSSADGQFSTVEPATDIMFPALPGADARIADLEARIAALEALIAELQGE